MAWIRIHGLAPDLRCRENIDHIVGLFKYFDEADPSSGSEEWWSDYVRVRMKIYIAKPLPTGFNCSGEGGKLDRISFERLTGKAGNQSSSSLSSGRQRFPRSDQRSLSIPNYWAKQNGVRWPHRRSSWIWSSILKGREALIKGLRRSIGNDKSTWIDETWFPGTDDFKCHPEPLLKCRVADCIDHDRRCWKVEKLLEIFPNTIVREILLILNAPPNWEDRWIWHNDKKGVFTVKSCYALQRRVNDGPTRERQQISVEEWKWLWQLSIPSKIKLFCGNAAQTLFPRSETFIARNVVNPHLVPAVKRRMRL
ncbi:hypothetical protein LINPERPRIM_LOCUS19122 [Linum perenne]